MSMQQYFHYKEKIKERTKAKKIRDFDLIFDVRDREVILYGNCHEFSSFAESEEIEPVVIEKLALGAEELPILF